MGWSVFLWLFLFILPLSVYSQGGQLDSEKPSVFIYGGSLFKAHFPKPLELSPEGKSILKALTTSKKLNVVLYGLENNPKTKAMLQGYLKEIGEEKSTLIFSDAQGKLKGELRRVANSDEAMVFTRSSSPSSLREGFYRVVDNYHSNNGKAKNFQYAGKDPLKVVPDSIALILDFGVSAFDDDFSFDTFLPKLDYSVQPIACRAGKKELKVELCLEGLDTEYRWIHGNNNICGLYEPKKNKAIKEVDYLLCEPQRVQDFEEYLKKSVGVTCNEAQRCLGNFLNDEAIDLVDSFEKIAIFERVHAKRIAVYNKEDEDEDYRSEFDKIILEIESFKKICEDRYLDKWLADYFKSNPDKKEKYVKLMDKTRIFYVKNLADYMEADEIKLLLKNSKESFNHCIKERTFQLGKDSFKECSSERMAYAIAALKEKLTDNSDELARFGAFLKKKLNGICPVSLSRYGDGYSDMGFNRFDLEYDSNRCFSAVVDSYNDFKEESGYAPLLSDARAELGGLGVRYDTLKESFSRFLNEDECESKGDKEEDCSEIAIKKAKAEAIFIYLSEEGAGYDNEEGQIRRNSQARASFINKASQDRELWECLSKKEGPSECAVLASKYLRRDRGGFLGTSSRIMAKEALLSDLEGITKELDHEISVFHWGADSLSGFNSEEPVPLNSMRGYTYLRLREHMFHTGPILNNLVEDPGKGRMAGRGLYAAADPNSTSSYGETLFEIRIPKGSRYLDLREEHSSGKIPVSKDTLQKLTMAGCKLDKEKEATKKENIGSDEISRYVSSPRSPYTNSRKVLVNKAAFEKDGECNRIFKSIIHKLDINLLAYVYRTEKPSFCDRIEDQTAAFVMIDTSIRGHTTQYNKETIAKAIKDYEEKDIPIPEEIQRILQINYHSLGDDSVNQKVNKESSQSDAISYWKDRIFQCNGLNESDRVSNRGIY